MPKIIIKEDDGKKFRKIKTDNFIVIAKNDDNQLEILMVGNEDDVVGMYIAAGKELMKHAVDNM